jgi:hypothetical protein
MGKGFALIAACVALLALGLAPSASANWTHKGKGELKENAAITLKGELALSTVAGEVKCPVEIAGTLTGSGSSGDIASLGISEPSKCDLTGALATVCGTHGLTKVEKTGTWSLAAEAEDIKISGVAIDYAFAGCAIPSLRIEGSTTGAVDKVNGIGSVTLSGSQTLYNALGEEAGSAQLKGTLAASPAGTYGLKSVTVETGWTMENTQLGEDGEMTLAGGFSFSGTGGGVSCEATGKAALTSATVEEEASEGEIESFAVSEPAKCDVTGTLKTLCGTNSVSSVEKTGTWDLGTDGEDISVSNLALDFKFSKCAVTSIKVEGDATLTVDDPTGIESVTFGGTLSTYNSGGEKTGTAEAGGTQSASPAGTFQLEETPPCEESYGIGGKWFDMGVSIPKCTEIELPLTGVFSYDIPELASSFGCVLDMTITAEPGGGAEVSSFETTTSGCEGTGLLAGCVIVADESNSPEVDVSKMDFTITNLEYTFIFGEGCLLPASLFTWPEMTLVPNNPESISSVTISGKGSDDVSGLEFGPTGTLSVTGGKAGTYGIG